jgi:hypothetical protein
LPELCRFKYHATDVGREELPAEISPVIMSEVEGEVNGEDWVVLPDRLTSISVVGVVEVPSVTVEVTVEISVEVAVDVIVEVWVCVPPTVDVAVEVCVT